MARHGSTVNGFVMLRGEASKLDTFRRSDEFKDLVVEASLCLDGFGVVDAYVGDGLKDLMHRWVTNIPR